MDSLLLTLKMKSTCSNNVPCNVQNAGVYCRSSLSVETCSKELPHRAQNDALCCKCFSSAGLSRCLSALSEHTMNELQTGPPDPSGCTTNGLQTGSPDSSERTVNGLRPGPMPRAGKRSATPAAEARPPSFCSWRRKVSSRLPTSLPAFLSSCMPSSLPFFLPLLFG